MFGICLGTVMGGARRQNLQVEIGHHGGNHPVQQTQTGKVEITAHNHNFAVDPDYDQSERGRTYPH